MFDLHRTKMASRVIGQLSTTKKNRLLEEIIKTIDQDRQIILEENQVDMQAGEAQGLGEVLDRILLTSERLDAILDDIKNVITLEDEVGKTIDTHQRPNGLVVSRKRVPLGTVLMIYEARPNVTVDASVLALKSGNAVVLKGGSNALNSNRALVKSIHRALENLNLPLEIVTFIDSTDRQVVQELLQAKEFIDVVIPRGGKGLIDFVVENSRIPVIETGASVVHIFVDKEADLDKALKIVINAKTRRVSVCNAVDVILVHTQIAKEFLNKLSRAFYDLIISKSIPNLQIRADEGSFKILKQTHYSVLVEAQENDFDTEFLDYVLGVKIVENLEAALEHIQVHSLKHSEAIITENQKTAERFLKIVDAACVYHNTSTAFSDGAQFGLGAEIGIATQKLHVRGPFALEGLTTYKWVIEGDGQVRD